MKPGLETPWRSARFRWFALGNVTNNVGEAIFDIALPLYVYQQTQSIVLMGFLAALVPFTLLLGPIFGAWADERGAGRLVSLGLWIQLAAMLVFAGLISAGALNVPLIALSGVIIQVAGACYRVGWMTGVPGMFPDTPVRARGTLSSLFIGTTIVGPILVGVLLPVAGYELLFYLNLLTFLAPLAVYHLGVRPVGPPSDGHFDGGVLRGIRVGWSTLVGNPVLRRVTILMLPFDFVLSATFPALAIFYLRDGFALREELVATLFAVMNVGALVGALLVSERRTFNALKVTAVLTVCLAIVMAFASLPVLGVVLVALTVMMAIDGAGASTQSMAIVQLIPQSVFGRASGVIRLVHGVPALLGPVFVAVAVPGVGAQVVFVLLAGVAILAAVAMFLASKSIQARAVEVEG